MTNGSSSSSNSGCGATPLQTPKRTNIRKSITGASHTPTSTYASGIPGWKTDRGRIYIIYGPPDEIESHASGGTYERPIEEGGGETSTYPFEKWRYRYIDGIGTNVNLEFVDTTMTGEYHFTTDPSEKDALLMVPGAGLTMSEQMGIADKTQRFQSHRRHAPRHRQPAAAGKYE